jgi:hypothetical protein
LSSSMLAAGAGEGAGSSAADHPAQASKQPARKITSSLLEYVWSVFNVLLSFRFADSYCLYPQVPDAALSHEPQSTPSNLVKGRPMARRTLLVCAGSYKWHPKYSHFPRNL